MNTAPTTAPSNVPIPYDTRTKPCAPPVLALLPPVGVDVVVLVVVVPFFKEAVVVVALLDDVALALALL
jgi:hypothetical protein